MPFPSLANLAALLVKVESITILLNASELMAAATLQDISLKTNNVGQMVLDSGRSTAVILRHTLTLRSRT